MALPNSHYEKRGPDEVCIDDALPFEIPENWTWARLSSACVSIADGDHQPPPQVQDGIPFLVISNVSMGESISQIPVMSQKNILILWRNSHSPMR